MTFEELDIENRIRKRVSDMVCANCPHKHYCIYPCQIYESELKEEYENEPK